MIPGTTEAVASGAAVRTVTVAADTSGEPADPAVPYECIGAKKGGGGA